MSFDEKMVTALLDLLSSGDPVNISRLSKKIGVSRQRIYKRIYKHRGVQ